MSALSRLSTALIDANLSLPEGAITLVRPPLDYDVSALPRDRVHIQHSFAPDADGWTNAGFPVSRDMPKADLAIVVVPRAKALARSLIAQAAAVAKVVVVDGQKTDGIDSHYKACRKALGQLPTIPKDHGRMFWFDTTDAFADWIAPPPAKGEHGFYTAAGVFSDGAVDRGSALLAESLPEKLGANVVDLGAGWGFLSDEILKREAVKTVTLIEAEALSLDCARLNVTDPRAAFVWADANAHRPARGYDAVVMNPPFHAGRASDPSLGRAFISSARAMLAPHGKLWMVANRHLPYEAALTEAFRNVDQIAQNGGFKVFHATRPQR